MLLVDFFYSRKAYENQFIVVILFPIFLACLLTRKGIVSRLTDYKFVGFPGKYAYSIYVMQEVAFAILKRTLWKNTDFLHDYPVAAIATSVFLTAALGIPTYYLVEQPSARFLKKTLQDYF